MKGVTSNIVTAMVDPKEAMETTRKTSVISPVSPAGSKDITLLSAQTRNSRTTPTRKTSAK
jgi:hypothetical protein